jgi:GTP cyclohydrolase I
MQILMSAIGENATEEDKASFPVRFQEMVHTLFKNRETVIEIVK